MEKLSDSHCKAHQSAYMSLGGRRDGGRRDGGRQEGKEVQAKGQHQTVFLRSRL